LRINLLSKSLLLLASFIFSNSVSAVFQEGNVSADVDGGLLAVAASDSTYVAVGMFTKVLHSDDGINWTKQVVPDNGMRAYQSLSDITYGNGTFVAVSQQNNIYSSNDGKSWTETADVLDSSPAFNSVTFSGTKFYAAGSYWKSDFTSRITSIIESADGATWTELSTIETSADTALVWDGNQLLLAGTGGKIWTSADGVTWVSNDAPYAVNDVIDGLASNGSDKTVAVGWHLTVMHSADGQNWTKIDYRDFSAEWQMGQTDVIWTDSEFVMVNNTGIISTSSDGENWTDDETFHTLLAFEDVASIGSQLVMVGSKAKEGGGKLPAFAYSGALNATSNSVPTANAGADQTVTAGVTVSLSGSADDSDGSISTYLWEQVSGTSVTLSATDAVDSSFTAPDVSANEDLVFKFTATDDASAAGSDEMTVTVNPANNTNGDSTNNKTTPADDDSETDNTSKSAMNPLMLLGLLIPIVVWRRKK